MMARPTMKAMLPRPRAQTACQAAAGAPEPSLSMAAAGAQARIEHSVEQIDDEVHHHHRGSEQHHEVLHHDEVALRDSLEDEAPEPRQIEDVLDQSEEHTSELQSLMRSSYAVFCL